MMKKVFLITCTLVLSLTFSFAQNKQNKGDGEASYNVHRGLEALVDMDLQEARRFFELEIKENPKSPQGYFLLGCVYDLQGGYGDALSYVRKALTFVENKDKKTKSMYYGQIASIYDHMGDQENRVANLQLALKCTPDDVELCNDLGDAYFEMGDYANSDIMFQKELKLTTAGKCADGNGYGYGLYGLGRNLFCQEKCEEALPYFDKAIQLYPGYTAAYLFRAGCYVGLNRYAAAADDIIATLEDDIFFATLEEDWSDTVALYWLPLFTGENLDMLIAKLEVQQIKHPLSDRFDALLARAYETGHSYAEAIETWRSWSEKSASEMRYARIAQCYYLLGDYDNALKNYNLALEQDSSDEQSLHGRMAVYHAQGRYDLALADANALIQIDPEYGNYLNRADMKSYAGDCQGAMEDDNRALMLAPEWNYVVYQHFAVIHDRCGDKAAAQADAEKVLELDTHKLSSARMGAAAYLGKRDEALALVHQFLQEENPEKQYYNIACVYSILNMADSALFYLQKDFETGWFDEAHMRHDKDLDNIRQLPQYKQLMQAHKERCQRQLALLADTTADEDFVEQVAEIPFTREGNLCKVKCTINGLPLHFYFDTGASDVTISNVEATFMMKNDYLTSQDVVGKKNYLVASGDVAEGTVINLKKVNFGGFELNNIQASVVKSQTAPLLLGQSVLQKLGKIEIDNEKRVLRITYKEKNK